MSPHNVGDLARAWHHLAMCNLHGIKTTKLEFLECHQASESRQNDLIEENDYAAPGKPAYVIRQEDGQRFLSASRWGLPILA